MKIFYPAKSLSPIERISVENGKAGALEIISEGRRRDYSKFVYDERFMKQIDGEEGFCWA